MMFLSWFVAKELTTKPGQFTPIGLFCSECEAKEYVEMLHRSEPFNRNYIVKRINSEEHMWEVCHCKEK